MEDTLPITSTNTFTTPYDAIAPLDLAVYAPASSDSATALNSLTSQFYSLELLTGIVKYCLTMWSIVWKHPFMLEYFLLLMALGVFFWWAHWIVNKRRSKGSLDFNQKVNVARQNVRRTGDWINSSNNPWRE